MVVGVLVVVGVGLRGGSRCRGRGVAVMIISQILYQPVGSDSLELCGSSSQLKDISSRKKIGLNIEMGS